MKVSLKGKKREGGDEVIIDTRNILFIAGGAFPGLEKHVAKRLAPAKTGIGFHASPVDADAKPELEELLNETQPGDLRQFGLIPEFIGRFPVLAPLEPLDEAALIRILTEPKNALVRQFQKAVRLRKCQPGIHRGSHQARRPKSHRTRHRGAWPSQHPGTGRCANPCLKSPPCQE